MKDEPVKAWQPLTFGGVARYGHDWLGRLFFTCGVVAILTASTIVWTFTRTWAPVIEESIARLPAGIEIRGGKLTAPEPLLLGENRFLSISLDPVRQGAPASSADLDLVLGSTEFRVRSLFGVSAFPYRPEWTIALNRAEMEPKWEAWRPATFAYLFFGAIAGLFASWVALAIVYAFPVRILAALIGRSLTSWGAWKLSVAAMMPGAILLTIVIGLYGLGSIRLTELIATWGLHFAVGWIFSIGAIFRLPRLLKAPANPFASEVETNGEETKEKNPFKASPKTNRGGPPSS